MQFPLIASIHAAEGQADALERALTALIEPTRAEDGCLLYDLHRDLKDPDHFVFYEIWATRDHWLAHGETPHIAAHRRDNGHLVASSDLWELARVGGPD